MKAIMISIQPQWCEKILNGEKTAEVRKIFSKDYVGWVYIYCTKGTYLLKTNKGYVLTKKPLIVGNDSEYTSAELLNGKVVSRFWCDNLEHYDDVCYWSEENEKRTCLTPTQFFDYLFNIRTHRYCYIIPINNLEIFDRPKKLSEFYVRDPKGDIPVMISELKGHKFMAMKSLTKAPQSWRYVEELV